MKVITYVTAGLWKNTGGPAESVPKILKEISLLNLFKINLITLEGDLSDNVLDLYNYNIDIHIVKKTSSSNLYFNPYYINIFNKVIPKSDIIHIQGVWLFPFWLASIYSLIYKKKIVISTRGSLSPNRLKKSKLKKIISKFLFDKAMLNNANLIHTTSKIEQKNVSNFGIKTKSFIVPNGVDIINKNKYKLKLINTEKKICLFLGRLDPIKGLDLLINVWNDIRNEDWLLVICGPDEKNYKKTIVGMVKKYNLENHVIFLDPVFGDQKFNLYTQSDVFILPSRGENFGISIAEAMICGLPVITTSFTPWDEIEENKCGWFINLEKDSLSRALLSSFTHSKSDLIQMGKRGIELIKRKYNWKNLSRNMSDIYLKLLNEK